MAKMLRQLMQMAFIRRSFMMDTPLAAQHAHSTVLVKLVAIEDMISQKKKEVFVENFALKYFIKFKHFFVFVCDT